MEWRFKIISYRNPIGRWTRIYYNKNT